MEQLISNPVFQAYIASAIALGVNLLVLAMYTVITRVKAAEVVNPEDKKLNADAEVVYDDGNSKTARVRRAHRNAAENIPLFLIGGLALTLTPVPTMTATILFAVFVVARWLQTLCYLLELQPWRTLSFVISMFGQVALLVMLGAYVLF